MNSLGVRDDEESLNAPEVIVVGDSYAMGWGVPQDQVFAQRLEVSTGLRVLNAGIPSYGSAREMALLDRIDTRCLRYLVIQFAENDEREDLLYMRERHHMPVHSEILYDQVLRRELRHRRYFFGKITWRILQNAVRPWPVSDIVLAPANEARVFLDSVRYASRVDLSHVQVIAFEVNPFDRMDGEFAKALERECRGPKYPAFIRHMVVLDFARNLKRGDYFDLDDHLRPSGHKLISDYTAGLIKQMEPRTEDARKCAK